MSTLPVAAPAPHTRLNPWLFLSATWAAFTAASLLSGKLTRFLFPDVVWLPQAAFKVLLFGLTLTATRIQGIAWRDLGFRRAERFAWTGPVLLGLGLGAAATLAVLASGATGLRPFLKGHSFLQLVLFVWLLSSASETLFCRGWFQTTLLGPSHANASLRQLLPVALLFGSLHLSLLFIGVDVLSVAILVPLLCAMGLASAWARARSGSLYPAFAVHLAFNLGGMVGGILYNIGYRVMTGQFPPHP